MKKSIRNLATSVDQSKILVVSDDLRIYLIDIEKGEVAANGFYEGHLDLITGIDSIPDSLNFVTWSTNQLFGQNGQALGPPQRTGRHYRNHRRHSALGCQVRS